MTPLKVIIHSKTKNIEQTTKNADILIAALGKPNFIKANMVRDFNEKNNR